MIKANLRVFDAGQRMDRSPARHAEPVAAFLNRVESQFFARVRDLIEEWFALWPIGKRAHLKSRLRSDDDRQMESAFWELYLHESFRRSGFEVRVEPDIDQPATPDFHIVTPDASFYLEATVAGLSDAQVAAKRRATRVWDALNRLSSPNFFLWLEVHSEGVGDPRASALRPKLERWLGGLDPDGVTTTYQPHDEAGADGMAFGQLPTHRWEEAGWVIVFRALPKKPEARGESNARPLAAWGPAAASSIDTAGPILRALEGKASRYGSPDLPLVLAVHRRGLFEKDHSFEMALFGSEAYDFINERHLRNPDGFWVGPAGVRYRRVSAVVGAINLDPWRVTQAAPRTWLNPWAGRQFAASPLPWPVTRLRLQGNQGEFQRDDGVFEPHSFFGLDADWPGSEDLADE